VIVAYAGNTYWGYYGDGGAAISAQFSGVQGIAFDSNGNLYIADESNFRVRVVTKSTGIISTYAGNGWQGYSGDGGPATSAQLGWMRGLVCDSNDNLYIADAGNTVIRLVTKSTGIISTYAGNGLWGYSGDGGDATSASLSWPCGLAVDTADNLYIGGWSNNAIRLVTKSTGKISTYAGNGNWGTTGDGGDATSAYLSYPWGVVLDSSNNLYFADAGNNKVRFVTKSTGIISTYAGTGQWGSGGDGGPATSAQLNNPTCLALDASGNLYITDLGNNVVRLVIKRTGVITTFAGTGQWGYLGSGLPATAAQLYTPVGIAVDSNGYVYFGELSNRIVNVVRPMLQPSAAKVSPHYQSIDLLYSNTLVGHR
jgi:trimeric autotransporter adhesin